MDTPADVTGRIARLLRTLAGHEPTGATTSVVARDAGLPRATAHRMLTALQSEGLVDRDPATAAWLLGPELFLLGAAAQPRYDVTAVARPHVRRLAQLTGESAFYSVRRGDETVCLVREDGDFPIRSHVLHEGARFPLGVVSAGLVVLAYLPDAEIGAYLGRTDLVAEHGPGHDPAAVRARVAEVRRVGWSLNPGLMVEGSWGMAAAVFDRAERPVGALTLTGIERRFGADRQSELGALLLREAHALTQRTA